MFDIELVFTEMLSVLEETDISYSGVFLNADPGFDSEEFKKVCDEKEIILNVKPNSRNKKGLEENYRYFDDELYRQRTKIEHANAWMDAFKALMIRYEKLTKTWLGLQWLALITLFSRKLKV